MEGGVGSFDADQATLLARARSLHASGDIAGAWAVCAGLADAARRVGDAAALADAALVVRAPADPPLRARVHALAAEALVRVDDLDEMRALRLRAQVAATRDPFHGLGGELHEPDLADPEAAFLRLQAVVAELQHPAHVDERLVVANRAVGLGQRTGTEEYEAWGRRWRMDAYAELGKRVDLAAEESAVAALVDRLGTEWQSWLLLTRSSSRMLEGRFADAVPLADEALRIGGEGGAASFFRLIHAWEVARWTGENLDGVETEVRARIDGMPFLARGWLLLVLEATGKRDEAERLWRAVRPHVERIPTDAPEWLIAAIGHAETALWLEDREVAALLYAQLLPHDGLHAMVLVHSPYRGPVSLALGRLAAILGRADEARAHLQDAVTSAEEVQALPHVALAHAELARCYAVGSRARAQHVEVASTLARRLGLRPLLGELRRVHGAGRPRAAGVTPREAEVAQLVSEGLTNALIAQRLTLSERTVENHVARLLHKLDLRTRTALAVWARDQVVTTDGGDNSD